MHYIRVLFTTLFLATITIFVVCTSVSAHFYTSSSSSLQTTHKAARFAKESKNCNHLLVTLHGNDTPKLQCLDKQSHANSVIPNLIPGNCPGNLELFENAQDNGGNICFNGNGNANLTDYCMPWNEGGCLDGTWNDKASSYISRTHGVLYSDINEGGSGFEVYANDGGDLYGIWNDVMSSVHVGDGIR